MTNSCRFQGDGSRVGERSVALLLFLLAPLVMACGGDDSSDGGGEADSAAVTVPRDPTAADIGAFLDARGVPCDFQPDDDIDASFPAGDFGACGPEATATGIAIWDDPEAAEDFFAEALDGTGQHLWAVVDPSGSVWLAPGDPDDQDAQERMAQDLADQLGWEVRQLG